MKNILKPLGLKRLLQASALVIGASIGMGAQAATSVQWNSPGDGSSYPTGTSVILTGEASGIGSTPGTGLDLVLVLDSSGSMGPSFGNFGSNGSSCGSTVTPTCKPRQDWQKEAAIALVNSIPNSTSVGIVEFDGDAGVVTGLTQLTTNIASVIAAINSVDASGGTNIPSGIDAAKMLLVASANSGSVASQQMVVFSDGSTSGNVITSSQAAVAAGVDAIHSVALPGANISTMQNIATNGNGTFINATTGLSALIDTFSGTGGTLVGLDYVEVSIDGQPPIRMAADAFGNFDLSAVIASGANTFVATAFGTDGTSASDTITLFGVDSSVNPVPVPASLPLLAFGLLGFAAIRRRMSKNK